MALIGEPGLQCDLGERPLRPDQLVACGFDPQPSYIVADGATQVTTEHPRQVAGWTSAASAMSLTVGDAT